MAKNDFSHRTLPGINKEVFRMGVAGNYGIESSDIEWAADHGVNYWVWGSTSKKMTAGLREVIKSDRETHAVAAFGWGYFGKQIRRGVEKTLLKLNTDYLDVLKLAWLGKTSAQTKGVMDTLLKLKDEGKIKAIGTSIHDRKRAGRLALDSEFDLFMIRYSAKHPGAEDDIFPHLSRRNPAVISYTALAWQQLIKPLKGIDIEPWPGDKTNAVIPPLTPELCYRFVLTNPHVHVVLTGPKTREQLKNNLNAVKQGPLPPEELEWVRTYGKLVKSKKRYGFF